MPTRTVTGSDRANVTISSNPGAAKARSVASIVNSNSAGSYNHFSDTLIAENGASAVAANLTNTNQGFFNKQD